MDNNSNSDKLGTEPIVQLLFKLSIPSIFAMAIQALYNIVDSIYIGHLSKEALSALSLCFPIQLILIGIAVGTGVGTSSLISRLLGSGNRERAANTAEHVLLIAVVYGVIIAAIGLLFSKNIIAMFTSDMNLIEMGSEYIRIIMLGSMGMFTPMISNNILRGQGNTFIPMITMLIGAIMNIVLDPLFIFGIGFFPKWGVGGAAFATIMSRIVSGTFILFILFSKKNELKLNFKVFSLDLGLIKEIYSVGFPAMVMQFLASFMVAGMNAILAAHSITAVAAAGIYFRLQSFIFMPIFGLNHGYLPIVGYNYGHKNPQRIKKVMKSTFIIAFAYTTAGFILFQLIPETLIKMFNNSPELVRIGTDALKIISTTFPIIGPLIIAAATFQALGKGLPSLILSFLRQMILLLPVMYLLGTYLGLDAVWYAFPISEVVTAVFASIWLSSVLKNTFKELQHRTSF